MVYICIHGFHWWGLKGDAVDILLSLDARHARYQGRCISIFTTNIVTHITPIIQINPGWQIAMDVLKLMQKLLNSQHCNIIIRIDGWTKCNRQCFQIRRILLRLNAPYAEEPLHLAPRRVR